MLVAQRLLVVVTAIVALSSAVAASTPVGTWKGHIIIDMSKLPKAPNPQAQQQMDQGVAKAKQIVVTLKLSANKTYTSDAVGAPGDPKDNGTWSLNGKTLSITSKKTGPANGKTK